MNLPEVATGEYWLAEAAFKLQLVDELLTSDNYLLNASKDSDLFEVVYEIKSKNLVQKFLDKNADLNSNQLLFKGQF